MNNLGADAATMDPAAAVATRAARPVTPVSHEDAQTAIRVLYVIGSLETGGAERQLLELLRRIDRSRFSVSLALLARSGDELACGLTDEILDLGIPQSNGGPWKPRGYYAARAVMRLFRFIRKHRPDVVHAILPGACMIGCPAGKLAGVPVVLGGRRSLAGAYRNVSGLKAAMDRVALLFTDYMVGNSRAVTDELRWLDGFSHARSATIYNGVDTERFSPSANRSLRRELGFSDSHVVLGTVANFFPYKRHVDLVRAAAVLSPQHPHLRFLAMGEDRGTLASIRREISENGLQGKFVLISGSEAPERVFAAMDIYVCTSETEGFSNVLLEAMASGKPVIGTDVGGNAEAVRHGETGLLVPPQDPRAIAQAVRRLVDSQELRHSMGKAARERAVRQFSLDLMTRSYEDFYVAALKRRAG